MLDVPPPYMQNTPYVIYLHELDRLLFIVNTSCGHPLRGFILYIRGNTIMQMTSLYVLFETLQ